ncbi:MAG: malto-oligosyltrehalose trehalohydrolase [Burkholderiaceae bacterium]|jgi:maltooligosyltrehalose trehalohydrolase
MRARHYQFGAEVLGPGMASFRIWAPDVASIGLELEDAAPIALTPQSKGWFELVTPCAAGTRYRYVLPDGTRVPDPASRAQACDVHDASVLIDSNAYVWQKPNWTGRPWHETVLYELHVGLLGGFAGVAHHLPALAALGVTAIELMPIADFPGARNWGYDGVLPYAPDVAYGPPDALRALVDRAHELDLMVFLDVVYNHFGPEGNYLGRYARDFFRSDVKTPWGEALDFRREEVRTFFTENARYWLTEFRLDGLRLDAVHAIDDGGWLKEFPDLVRASLDAERHVHLVVENDDNDAALLDAGFSAQWNDDVHHALHVLLTDETEGYYGDYVPEASALLARCLKEGFAYQGEASRHRDGTARGTPSAHLEPTSFVAFLQNHDQIGNRAMGERLSELASGKALRAATSLLLLSPWIPLLFMAEEQEHSRPFCYFTSYEGALADAVREGRRREFARFPAFTSAEARVRIPDPNNAETFHQSRPAALLLDTLSDPETLPHFISTLLELRKSLMACLQSVRPLDSGVLGEKAVYAHWRLADGRTLSVFVNLDTQPVSFQPRKLGPALGPEGLLHPLLFESAPGTRSGLNEGRLEPEACAFLIESSSRPVSGAQ